MRSGGARSRRLAVCVLLAGWLAGPGVARAQGPYEPPIFSYGEGKITLMEAVRLALEHDPRLLLRESDVRLQQGLFQEVKGAFDWTLLGELSYDYRQSELHDSTKKAEREKREISEIQAREECKAADDVRAEITILERAAQGEFGVELPQDRGLEAELRMLETLIQTVTDANVLAALEQRRNELVQTELTFLRRSIKELDFQCRRLREDRDRLGQIPEIEEFETGKFSLRLRKLFRTGIGLSPFITADYDHTQYKGRRNAIEIPDTDADGNPVFTELGTPITRFLDFGGKNIEDVYRAEVGFDVNLPLLRGRGLAISGPEQAAAADLEARTLSLEHSAAESALAATLAYWNLLAAQERLQVLERSVEIQNEIAKLTDQLIEGDVVPRVERARALAGVANAQSQVEAAQQALIAARLELARAMGVDVESEGNAPLAEGPFPAPPAAAEVDELEPAELAEQALEERADRRAAYLTIRSSELLAEAARFDLPSRLDLGLRAAAGATAEKEFTEAVDHWTYPSGGFNLGYEKAFGNNERLARYAQRLAQLEQRQISAADLDRNIRIALVDNLEGLAEALDRLEQAEVAARNLQEMTASEIEKLRLGSSTLIDTLLTEQQKTSASLELVAAQQEVANRLARLRFESGTLVEESETGNVIRAERLVTLPTGNGGGSR